MSLTNRSLVTIDDLSNGEIEAVFSLADEMSESMDKQSSVCQGKIMASLFFEPSTRTRLSFETAMHRLGGGVITASDIFSPMKASGNTVKTVWINFFYVAVPPDHILRTSST